MKGQTILVYQLPNTDIAIKFTDKKILRISWTTREPSLWDYKFKMTVDPWQGYHRQYMKE